MKGKFLVVGLAVAIVAITLFLGTSGTGLEFAAAQSGCKISLPILAFYSDSNFRASSENRYASYPAGQAITKANGQIGNPYPADIQVSVETLDPLPPGLRLAQETVTYGIPLSQLGGSTRARHFYFAGTPTQLGEYQVRLRATSPGCTTDTGLVIIRIDQSLQGVQCTLASAGPVQSGGKATLSWKITGPVSSASITPSVPVSPAALKASGSGQTNTLTADTDFTLTVNGPLGSTDCSAKVLVGGTSGSAAQFVRTLLDIPTISRVGGGQFIQDAIFWNGRFVYSGSCGVRMDGVSLGGGLWVVKEDGTGSVQEREACLDAGAGSNFIYHHGLVDGATLSPDGNRGFVRGNGSWASCLVRNSNPFDSQDCREFGPGANRAVYYEADGNNKVKVLGLSPGKVDDGSASRGNWQAGFAVADGNVLSQPSPQIFRARLPGWTDIESQPSNAAISLGFNKYFIGRELQGTTYNAAKVYAPENGALRAVQDLPGNPSFIFYALDYSTTPERLIIFDSGTRAKPGTKLLTYEATSSGLRLVSERQSPGLGGNPNVLKGGFGAWGEYIIWPGADGFTVWKGGQKVETVRLPEGGTPTNIVVSKSGYLTVVASHVEADNRNTAAYLYKIGGGAPPPDGGDDFPPGGDGVPTSTIHQTLNVAYGPTSTAPEVLTRNANVISIGDQSLKIMVFGKTYDVDAASARILNSKWAAAPLTELLQTRLVNVWGALDLENPALIHARTVRNPAPFLGNANSPAAAPRSFGTGSGNTAPASVTAPATQSALDALRKALQDLRARFAQ